MRKDDMDNLRNFAILLLFPVHTFMIWNDFGSGFYIWMGENKILSTLIVMVNPWFMPLLFVLAGMSARYALDCKTTKAFVAGRIRKLLVPFVVGMACLVPVQSLYARKFQEGYREGIWTQWKYFYTHYTDLTGYDGAFTPGHLWFVLFLFVIAMVSLPIFFLFPYQKSAIVVEKMCVWEVLLLFIPIWMMYYLGNFGGFSIGKSLALYLAGYYVLSNERVRERLEEKTGWLVALGVLSALVSAALYARYSYYGDLWVNFVGWNTVLAWLAVGKKCLNRRTWLTVYLNRVSYPVYLLHQTVLVVLAYYVVESCRSIYVQVPAICFGSLVLTVFAYHVLRGLWMGILWLIRFRSPLNG